MTTLVHVTMALWIEWPPHYPEVGGSNTNVSPKSFSILSTTCGKDAKKGSRYTINAMITIYEEVANVIQTASKPSWTTLGLSIYGLARPELFQIRFIFLHDVGIWLRVNP